MDVQTESKEGIIPLNDKRTINGWAIFDWANSSYALVISVAIFPIYFLSVTNDEIQLFGKQVTNSGVYAFSIAFAYIMVAMVSPLLSGIADFSGRKKFFLKFFTTLGSLACISMFFFFADQSLNWLIGSITFIVATIGFAGSLVFYNSYLPEIASEDQFDRVSAKGFAYGYVGSVILLLTNLLIIQKPEWFGITDSSLPARLAFVMVGLWWLGFAQITFRRLPKDKKTLFNKSVIFYGYKELLGVWKEVRNSKYIKRFLMAFFFYSAGVQTVIYMASVFAEKELNFMSSELILVIILLQVVAIGGAYFFAWTAGRKGSKVALIAMLIIWILICSAAYFVDSKYQFYIIASAVGVVMGGIQAISRSSYSKLIPETTKDTTSYFSFYDVLEKSAIVFGTFSFGIIEQISGGMRNSVLALALFFVVGLIILKSVNFNDVSSEPKLQEG